MAKTRKQVSGKSKTRKSRSRHAEIVSFFMEMLTTIKLYHWKTHSYSQHKATDNLYESLQEHIDKFVEVMLGKGGSRVNMVQKCLHIFDFRRSSDFKSQLLEYREFLLRMNQFLDKTRDSDLLNIRDEILADVNQFLYLWTFDQP